MKGIGIAFILLVFLSVLSCDRNESLFEGELSLENNTWDKDQTASFEFLVNDTLTYYDFYLNVRNTESYPYSNIYLFTTMYFPNGKIAVDTIECILANPSGKWIGSGLGGIYDNRIQLQRKKAFPLNGKYTMQINQAMRGDSLVGITDVGFGVVKNPD